MRLAITSHDLIGDTLMQTPALRALRRAYPVDHIAYYTDNRFGAHAVLIGNPNLDELDTGPAGPADISIMLTSQEAFARAASRSLADGYAACLGVTLGDHQLDYMPTRQELTAGEKLARSVGEPGRVVVIGRHTRSCMSNQGGAANKLVANEIWCEVGEALIAQGYIPLAIGTHEEQRDPRFPTWPGPTLYGQPIRIVAGLLRVALAVLSVECGLLPLAVAVGANVYATNTGLLPSTLGLQPTREGQGVILDTTDVRLVTAGMILAGFQQLWGGPSGQ